MANLEINFGGVKMRNPVGIAPLNPAIAYAREPKVQVDWLMKHIEAGAGYIFLSANTPHPHLLHTFLIHNLELHIQKLLY